jgi:hypothetical protein
MPNLSDHRETTWDLSSISNLALGPDLALELDPASEPDELGDKEPSCVVLVGVIPGTEL